MANDKLKRIFQDDEEMLKLLEQKEQTELLKELVKDKVISDIETKQVKIEFLKGEPGEKGDSPTPEEITALIEPLIPDPIPGEEGKRGRDGIDGVGIQGIPGKDGSPDTGIIIATKLNGLKEVLEPKVIIGYEDGDTIIKRIKKQKLELSDIRNMPLNMNDMRWHGGGISDIVGLITAGNGVTITGTGTASSPFVISSTGAAIGGTITGGTPGSVLFVGTASALTEDNANLFYDDTNNRIGLGTTAPTNTITLGSTTTGLNFYRTTDQITNWESTEMRWSGTTFQILSNAAGTGTVQDIVIGAGARRLVISSLASTGAFFSYQNSTGSLLPMVQIVSTRSAASADPTELYLNPTYTGGGSAGYTTLRINTIETLTGSGAKRLMALQVSSVDRFAVDNVGNTVISSLATQGLSLYNTADQTTNFELLKASWSGNVFTLATSKGGTGTTRNLQIGTTSRFYLIDEGGAAGAFYNYINGTSSTVAIVQIKTGRANSSGENVEFLINPTYTQTSTAGYKTFKINAIESTLGSGVKMLMDLQTNSVSKFTLDNLGNAVFTGTVQLKGYTVATLPAGTQGMTAYVTDAVLPTFLGALTGGGTVPTPVWYNGTAWQSY